MVWPTKTLGDGIVIPGIGYGLGTANYGKTGPDGVSRELVDSMKAAISAGYRHIDNAEAYANEASSGVAYKESGLKRDEVFITTKVITEVTDIKATLKKQLEKLKVDYVDLYLIHDPTAGDKHGLTRADLWRQMEACKQEGLAKSIGVSNYRVKHLQETLEVAKEKISANQIELHPYVIEDTQAVLDFCAKHNITIEAYSPSAPLTSFPGGPVDSVVEKIAKELKATPGQVYLKWAQAKGAVVVTTSGKPERMKEQLDAGELPDLTSEQVDAIQKAGIKGGIKRKFMAHTVL